MNEQKFEVVIGLEIHAQCNTATKMFCSCSNDSFGKEPNLNTCPVCMGFPGMMPMINQQAINKGVLSGLALGCTIPKMCKFDRKNYFYPDLPKAFQISQYDQPLAVNGKIEIEIMPETDSHGNAIGNPEYVEVGIERLHMEEDAGKLTHVSNGTLCDYNRSGSPLMEIVSKPDMRSIAQASAYAREVQRILRSVGTSDADMEKGMMRFDINVSIRPFGQAELGTKVEVKNVNSFRSLERSLAYEIQRQSALALEGKWSEIVQETRGWDDEAGVTESQRSKEAASDYRYFPEPDLPPLTFEEGFVSEMRSKLPELPIEKKKRFIVDLGLNVEYAGLLVQSNHLSMFFESALKTLGNSSVKKVANMIVNVVVASEEKSGREVATSFLTVDKFVTVMKMLEAGEISSSVAKELIEYLFENDEDPKHYVESRGLIQVSDDSFILDLCKNVVALYPNVVAEIQSGKDKAIGFLVGTVMKDSKGKANPEKVSQMIKTLINN